MGLSLQVVLFSTNQNGGQLPPFTGAHCSVFNIFGCNFSEIHLFGSNFSINPILSFLTASLLLVQDQTRFIALRRDREA